MRIVAREKFMRGDVVERKQEFFTGHRSTQHRDNRSKAPSGYRTIGWRHNGARCKAPAGRDSVYLPGMHPTVTARGGIEAPRQPACFRVSFSRSYKSERGPN